MNQRLSRLNHQLLKDNQFKKADSMLLELSIICLVLGGYLPGGWVAAHSKVLQSAEFTLPPTAYQLEKMSGPGTHKLLFKLNSHYFQ